jgi:phosphate transport system substrate-binding protein
MTSSLFRGTALTATLLLSTAAVFAQDITGAGASFPAPIYSKWADAYNKATNARLNYQSIGSGGGIKQIKSKTVDFGASDAPLKDDELSKDGMVQFPMVIGGVVPVVNIKGITPGQIKMTGQALGDIYLGKIVKWNDPALTALNPGVALPDAAIAVVRRADGSGMEGEGR